MEVDEKWLAVRSSSGSAAAVSVLRACGHMRSVGAETCQHKAHTPRAPHLAPSPTSLPLALAAVGRAKLLLLVVPSSCCWWCFSCLSCGKVAAAWLSTESRQDCSLSVMPLCSCKTDRQRRQYSWSSKQHNRWKGNEGGGASFLRAAHWAHACMHACTEVSVPTIQPAVQLV